MRSFVSFALFTSLVTAAPLAEPVKRATSDWWYANIDHFSGPVKDYAPFGGDGYQVFYNVSDAGSLQNAVQSGHASSDLISQPRVIYIAPGTYELSETLSLYTDTVLVGDAVNPPTIKATSDFDGNQLIQGGCDINVDHDTCRGELKFSTLIKNVILDTTELSGTSDFIALSWRVAQNSGLVNVVINMPQGAHTGISVGQGSTVQVGDVTLNYGNIGINHSGNQQTTYKNITFNKCTTGLYVSSGFVVNVFHSSYDTVGFPVVLKDGLKAWLSIIDATVTNSGNFCTSYFEYPNLMVENIVFDNMSENSDVVIIDGQVKVPHATNTGTYVFGNTYGADPIYQQDNSVQPLNRPSALVTGSNNFYPVSSADNYVGTPISDVVNLKDSNKNGGVQPLGDGRTNDGPALQSAINYATSNNKLAYLPFGVYVTEQTILIPVGTKLVGNGWSTISGRGSNFTDASNPTPIIKVGDEGDVGVAQLQDLHFTVAEELAGAIILQINMAGNSPGDVSIHNSMITVGGTPASPLDCSDSACQAAYTGLHLTKTSSAYIDNMWAWVADHTTDGAPLPQSAPTGYAAKGGVLIESTQATWLAGMASEHWWLYNLAYNAASNVFMSFFQSETNYNQMGDLSSPPSPWTAGSADPDFSWCAGGDQACRSTIAQYWSSQASSNIRTYASASWHFGSNQQFMDVISTLPENSVFYGLCAASSDDVMRLPDGTAFGDTTDYSGGWTSIGGELVANYTSGA